MLNAVSSLEQLLTGNDALLMRDDYLDDFLSYTLGADVGQ